MGNQKFDTENRSLTYSLTRLLVRLFFRNQKFDTVKDRSLAVIKLIIIIGLLIGGAGVIGVIVVVFVLLPGVVLTYELAKDIFGEYAPLGIIAVIGLFILLWIGENIEKIVKKK